MNTARLQEFEQTTSDINSPGTNELFSVAQPQSKETVARSVVKATSYRIAGTSATIASVYLVTGRVDFAAIIGGTEFVSKIVLFFLHERLWERIPFGRKAS